MIHTKELLHLINKYEKLFSFDVSIVINHINNQQIYRYYADKKKPSGSLIKLYILSALLKYVYFTKSLTWESRITIYPNDRVFGAGVIKYLNLPVTISLEEAARYMIIYSDNIATNKIIDILSLDYINKSIKEFGAKDTVLALKMMHWDGYSNENITTAIDIADFYSLMFVTRNSRDVPPGVYTDCKEIMLNLPSCFATKQFLKYVVPALKSGPLNAILYFRALAVNSTRNRLASKVPKSIPAILRSAGDRTFFHDSGIFFTDNGPVIVVMMITSQNANFLDKKDAAFQAASQLSSLLGKIAVTIGA